MEELSEMPSGEKREHVELLAAFGAPAYVRRARGVEEAFERLLRDCERQRDEWLLMVKIRLATLFALTDGNLPTELLLLHETLKPTLRSPVAPSTSVATVSRELGRLAQSIARFNVRWTPYIAGLDLSPINNLRDGYNRWYLIEKTCALRNDAVARYGYEPLAMLDHAEMLRRLPLLPDMGYRAGDNPG